MSFKIVRTAVRAEGDDSLHEARLLILLRQITKEGDGTIEGITKLAKLDFLLRYPKYLERVLAKIRKRPPTVPMQSYENDTVESKMIRFRYGPWDHRYRRWIALLVSKGLANTFLHGRTVHVKITLSGLQLADRIAATGEFKDLEDRSVLIASTLGRLSGTRLKDIIYEVVPELTGMAWGEEISA